MSLSVHALTEIAINEAFDLGHTWVGTEHLLLALTMSIDGFARNALATRKVTRERIVEFILQNAEAAARAPSHKASTKP
jgi:hypothetical protein